MDNQRKKESRQQWKKNQRAEARDELPLPVEIIKAMFDMLDAELPGTGCDHTRRLSQHWLEQNGHSTEAMFAWLDRHGGFCDCEVLANVEERFREAMRDD